MRKIQLSILIAVIAALLLAGVALAGYYSFCSNVYHGQVKVAKVCVTWNISNSETQVRANTHGTRSVLFYVPGYTAVLGTQICSPFQVWGPWVTCTSKTTFKQGGWPIGGIRQTCVFTPGHMVCSVRTVLAEPEAK